MKHIRPALTLTCLLLGTSALQATPILPGHTVVPEAVPNPSGAIDILDEVDGSFSFGSGPNFLSGYFDHGVLVDPFGLTCAGCLDFFYEVELDEDARGGIFHAYPGLFNGFETSVAYIGDFGVAPLDTSRGPGGAFLDFSFAHLDDLSNYIHPGQNSAYLIVATNATSYDRSGTLGIFGAAGPNNSLVYGEIKGLFSPVAVPEPGSLSLLAAGAIGLLLASRRRKTVTSAS